MKYQSAFLTAIISLTWILATNINIETCFAANATGTTIEQANAAGLQVASAEAGAHVEDRSNHSSSSAFARFEPLLLLLLGSTLFLLGTAINLMLSKRIKGKSIQAVTSNK